MHEDEQANFDRWFEGSKVVDRTGKPLVVYHGTASDFHEPSDWLWATDSTHLASKYSSRPELIQDEGDAPNVMPVYMALRTPLVIDANGSAWHSIVFRGEIMSTDDIAGEVEEGGLHDGVIFKNVLSLDGHTTPATEYVSFQPEQAKSAISNSGLFDRANANITDAIASAQEARDFLAGLTNKKAAPHA